MRVATPSVSGEPGKPVRPRDRAEMRAALERAIQRVERQQVRLRIQREEGLMEKHKDMHFHFQPEIFLQVAGSTDFRFPKETFRLRPDEIGIMPVGVPHAEVVSRGEDGTPFRNLVVGFYSHTLSLHFASEVAPGRPDIEAIEFFDAPNLDVFLTLTNSLAHTYHMQAPARDQVLKGLLMSLLGMLLNLVDTGSAGLNADQGKVFQVKWLVRDQFSNAELNVKGIAERLQCSPDYLSHLFHRETGEKLIQYIHRVRIEGAIMALETLKEPCRVLLHSDSQYVIKAMNEGWAEKWKARGWRTAGNQAAANPDLWERMLRARIRHRVTFKWVKGHSGVPENERADRLANEGAKGALQEDAGYGP